MPNDGPARATAGVQAKRARRFLCVYLLIMCGMYAYFDWRFSTYKQTENEYPFVLGLISIVIAAVAIWLMIRAAISRAGFAVVIYVIVVALIAIRMLDPLALFNFDLIAKAHAFSAYPGLCPIQQKMRGSAILCYEYWYDGVNEALVLDKAREISAPFRIPYPLWTEAEQERFNVALFGADVATPALIASRRNDCGFDEIWRLAGDIYLWSNSNCWGLRRQYGPG